MDNKQIRHYRLLSHFLHDFNSVIQLFIGRKLSHLALLFAVVAFLCAHWKAFGLLWIQHGDCLRQRAQPPDSFVLFNSSSTSNGIRWRFRDSNHHEETSQTTIQRTIISDCTGDGLKPPNATNPRQTAKWTRSVRRHDQQQAAGFVGGRSVDCHISQAAGAVSNLII